MSDYQPADSSVPKSNDAKDVNMVKSLFEKAKKAREQFDRDWPKFEDYYNGNQWDQRRPSYRAAPVANICRSTVQSIVPIMTDAQPSFEASPKEPTDFEFADIMSKLIDHWWNRNNMNMKLVDVLMDCSIKDIGFMKVIWDEDAEEGAGDVRIGVPSPESIYVPENAKDFDDDCPWVIHEMYKTLGEVKRAFPKKAGEIKAVTTSYEKKNDEKSNVERGYGTLTSPIDRRSNVQNLKDENGNDNEYVRIWECWMDDWSTEEYELETEGKKTKEVRYKYPNGKVVKILPDQNLLLESQPNPRKDGKKPFVRFVTTVKPRCFYGEGQIRPLVRPQQMLNRVLANIYDSMAMMGNPTWVVDTDSGVYPQDLTNQTGLIVQKNPGSEVRRESPTPIPGYIMELYSIIMRLVDMTSGVHDVTQGRKPAGVTAAEAINELQEAAQTRLRLAERNVQGGLVKLGYLVSATMMQYYKEPRVFKLTGKRGWPEYFEFYIDDSEDGYTFYKRDYNFNEETEQYTPEENWTEGETKGLFDITVHAGTALPFMKEKRNQAAFKLHQAQVIDDEELLTVLDWPRKEEVMRRVQQKRDELAEEQPPPM